MTTAHPFAQRLAEAGLLPERAAQHAAPSAWSGPSAPASDDRARRYAEAALVGECRNIAEAPEGTRNDALNRAAYKMGGYVTDGHIGGQAVIDGLTEAALAAGLGMTEINRTVGRATSDGAGAPRQIILKDTAGPGDAYTMDELGPAAVAAQVVTPQAWALEHLPIINWHTLWADQSEEEWLVEPLIPAGRLIALYSQAKTGKSLLMLEIAAAMASGRPVLGNPTVQAVTLYVDFENDPRGDVLARLQAMGYGPGDLDALKYLSFPALSALDSERGGAELMAAVEAYGARVVVIDTVSRAVAGEENANDTWLAFYRHTGLLLKRAAVACIRLDHAGKDETKGQRGGSAKTGDIDAVWRLSVIDDEQLSLTCELARMPVTEKDLVLIRKRVPHLAHEVDTSGRKWANDNKVAEIVAALDALHIPTDVTLKAASVALRSTGLTARQNLIGEAVKIRKATVSPWDEQSPTGRP